MPSSLAIAVPNGTTWRFGAADGTWDFDNSAYVRNIRLEGCSRTMHDVTALSQTGSAQYIASSVTQPGKMILDMYFDEDLIDGAAGLIAALDGSVLSRTAQAILITAPDTATITGTGLVESFDVQIDHDAPRTMTVTIQLTSLLVFAAV